MYKSNRMHIKTFVLLSLYLFASVALNAQNKFVAYVDKQGILRWQHNGEEVKGFGANYTLPFAYAYRNAVKMGLNTEQLIDEDVYHYARLGFDLFRVHVWDTEISDTAGNLLQNEHLRLFDYLLMRLKQRGIRCIITPIAYWGNGWPEPDLPTPGFSHKYGKDACLTHPQAIKAQQNYLTQFLNHVNPYTGIAYKNDDQIIAFEISNEPHHRESIDSVRQFINGMVNAMRKTGTRKPILYNMSHSVQSAEAYLSAAIQGGTFQWYPTGLGAGHSLGGNLLPNVDAYTIPYTKDRRFQSMAKIVYEFDAADVAQAYIYPAMARSFRTAGLQLATHFAYDPTYSAYANTEYGTHYMNLLYTPQKALALKIAAAVFHRVPLYRSYGKYPADTVFDAFRVSYTQQLAEMVTTDSFFYTHHTSTLPPHPQRLKAIAGWGNSPVVQYAGTGAYFLDKLEDGLWRLEVLPDVVWVNDPFGKTSLDKPVAVLKYQQQTMKIMLPDLSSQFAAAALAEGKLAQPVPCYNGALLLKPGVYLLSRNGDFSKVSLQQSLGNITIGETAGRQKEVQQLWVQHTPPQAVFANHPLKIKATVVAPVTPQEVLLYVQTPGKWFKQVQMQAQGYVYEASLDAAELPTGMLNYYLLVRIGNSIFTYPGAHPQTPMQWDYTAKEIYRVPVLNSDDPITLFHAASDAPQLLKPWRSGSQLIPIDDRGNAAWKTVLETLEQKDPENTAAQLPHDYTMHFYFGDKVAARKAALEGKTILELEAWTDDTPLPLQVALVNKEGIAYGTTVSLQPYRSLIRIPLQDLQPVPLVLLPRPFPEFTPYYFIHPQNMQFAAEQLESIQFSLGPGIENPRQPFTFYISRATLY